MVVPSVYTMLIPSEDKSPERKSVGLTVDTGNSNSPFPFDPTGSTQEQGRVMKRGKRKKWKEATLCPYTVRGIVGTHR